MRRRKTAGLQIAIQTRTGQIRFNAPVVQNTLLSAPTIYPTHKNIVLATVTRKQAITVTTAAVRISALTRIMTMVAMKARTISTMATQVIVTRDCLRRMGNQT